MSKSIRLVAFTLRSLAHGSIGAAYMGVGTALDHPARIVKIQNLTDVTLLFSWDGIEDNFRLPSNGFDLIDISANQVLGQGCYKAVGDRLYVKEDGSSPSSGTVDLSGYYGLRD